MKYSLDDFNKFIQADLVFFGLGVFIFGLLALFKQDVSILVIAFFFSGLCFFIIAIEHLRLKSFINKMSNNEINEINRELANTLLTNNEWYLTEHFIFIISTNIIKIDYADIVLMYYSLKFGKKEFYHCLNIVLKNGKLYRFMVNKYNENKYNECQKIILSKNSAILEEKTKENLKILHDKYNLNL